MDLRRLGRSVAVSLVFAFLVAAIATPPDPFTQALAVGLLLLVFVPVSYFVDAVRTGTAGT